ncbi:MAG: acylphosphatase [Proteobacteria bacterium]|nr:acylphosphatase [Pseudomonadota bacterium]
MLETAIRVVIEGRVQGVWFRGWTAGEAKRLNLRGWVRNLADGSVEAVFAGPAEIVDKMINACRKGPPAARVEALTQYPADVPEEAGFRAIG